MRKRKIEITTDEKDSAVDSKESLGGVPVNGAAKGQVGGVDDQTVTLTRAEYEELRSQVDELEDRYLRVAADYDNFRKRMEKEREDIICYANEALISELLPILDNLDRALESISGELQNQGVLEGVRMISNQLHVVLQQCGLEPVRSVGEPFDPTQHEAVGVLASGDHEEGTVIAELQKGYKLKGKIVRPSMVQVAGQRKDGDE